MNSTTQNNREHSIFKITIIGFFVNLILAIGKLLAGIFGNSGAMLADAIHSISDFATDIIVLFFVKLSNKPQDEDHKYGHGKYETLATVIIGIALLFIAITIFYNSIVLIHKVINGEIIERPEIIAVIAAAISILVKEILYRITNKIGHETNSPATIANAWHHRSDAFSSIGTLLGIGGAYFLGENWRILDPIAAIFVSLLITKVSYDLIIPGLHELLEKSLPNEIEKEIEKTVMINSELSDFHNLKTRRIGSSIAIEFHVRVPGEMTVFQSHKITQKMENDLRKKYGNSTQIIIHIEPKL